MIAAVAMIRKGRMAFPSGEGCSRETWNAIRAAKAQVVHIVSV